MSPRSDGRDPLVSSETASAGHCRRGTDVALNRSKCSCSHHGGHMSVLRIITVPVLLLAAAACGAFGSGGAVELSTVGAAAGSQWNATMSSPAAMAGVVQMTGTASMAPSLDSTSTVITIALANASPGGVHPWEVRSGECGAASRATTFGSGDAYKPLEVDSDGRTNSTVTIDSRIPASGRYSAVVQASAENSRTVVACGNLAAPTR